MARVFLSFITVLFFPQHCLGLFLCMGAYERVVTSVPSWPLCTWIYCVKTQILACVFHCPLTPPSTVQDLPTECRTNAAACSGSRPPLSFILYTRLFALCSSAVYIFPGPFSESHMDHVLRHLPSGYSTHLSAGPFPKAPPHTLNLR